MGAAFEVMDGVNSEITPFVHFRNEEDRQAMVAAVPAELHALVGGPPGGGKTTLAKAIGHSLDIPMARHQGDPWSTTKSLIGTRQYNPKTGEFKFTRGPLFTGFLLADEFNRNIPDTQAAVMEAMQEGHVTVQGEGTLPVPEHFWVIATSNLRDHTDGLYALTEANKDRFGLFVDLSLPYDEEDAVAVLEAKLKWQSGERPSAVADSKKLTAAKAEVREIQAKSDRGRIRRAQRIVTAVRENGDVDTGQSVLDMARPALGMLALGSSFAAWEGRLTLQDGDIDRAARYVLPHRMVLTTRAERDKITTPNVIEDVLSKVA